MTQREAWIRIAARRTVVIGAHLLLWTSALGIAFLIRFELYVPELYVGALLASLPVMLAIRTAVFFGGGLFRGIWRYTSAGDAIGIVQATTASTLLFALALLALGQPFPRSVVVIDYLLAMVLVGGARLSVRVLRPHRDAATPSGESASRVLVVGAGDAGELLVADLKRRYAGRYEVVGFVDDDPTKIGGHIHGVRVLGVIADLPRIVAGQQADQVLIAIPTANGAQMRRIVRLCEQSGAKSRTIPGLADLVDGQVSVNQLRPVAIEDLLGRDPVELDMALISREMTGRAVLVTGAGGSIGSELCRQVARFEPRSSSSWSGLRTPSSTSTASWRPASPTVRFAPCVADVAEERRMEAIFASPSPERRLPRRGPQARADDGVEPRRGGQEQRLRHAQRSPTLADRHGVERFVMISTDKAVNPTSVMGATKRVAEMYVQALVAASRRRGSSRSASATSSASNGSVIPIFQEQIARGGPVTVTHPEMTPLLHDDPRGQPARPAGRRDGQRRRDLRPRHGRAGPDRRPRAAT